MKLLKIIIAFSLTIITYPVLMVYYFLYGGVSQCGEFIFNTYEMVKHMKHLLENKVKNG